MSKVLKRLFIVILFTCLGHAIAKPEKKYDSFYPDEPSAKESFMCAMADSAGCQPISRDTLAELDKCATGTEIGGPLESIGYLLLNRYADSVFFQEMALRSHYATRCQLSMLESDARAPLRDAAWAVYEAVSPLIDVLKMKRKEEEEKLAVYSSRPLSFAELKSSESGIIPGSQHRRAIESIDAAIESLLSQIPFGGQEEVRKKMVSVVLGSPSKASFSQSYDLALANLAPKYREADKSFSEIQNAKTGEYNLSFTHKTELYKGPGARELLKRVDPQEKSLICRFDACFEKGPRNVKIGSFVLLAGATVMTLGSASPFLVAAASAGAVAMSASAVQDSCFKDTLNVTGEAINSCSAQTLANTTLSQMSKVQCAVDAALLALDAVPGLMLIKRAAASRMAARAAAAEDGTHLMSAEVRATTKSIAGKAIVGRSAAAEAEEIVIKGTTSRTEIKKINETMGKLGSGNDEAKLLAEYGYKKKGFSPDGVAVYSKKGSPDIVLPERTSGLRIPGKKLYKLSDEEKDHLFGVLSGKDPDKFVQASVPKWKLESVAGKVDGDELARVDEALEHIDDPVAKEYFIDELKDLDVLTAAQREKKVSLLVKRAENWNSPLNARFRLVAKGRQSRYAKDLERYRASYLKENPGAKAADIEEFAVRSAKLRRDRVAKLGKQCRSFKPNAATKEAGKLFGKYSVGLGVGMTFVNYSMANTELFKDDAPTFAKRLGFELVATYIMSKLGSRIASNPSSSYLRKYVQNNLVSFGGNVIEAGIYQYFLGGSEEEARKKIEELRKSPTYEQDIRDLEAYLEQRSDVQLFVDKYDDKIKETIGVLTGNPDYTEKDLEALDQAALSNPEVQEKIMDVIADDIYDEQMEGMTTGSSGLDRLLYNTGWNALSNSVNVGMSVAVFQAVCSNLDNTNKALAIFAGAQITRSKIFGDVYYEGRKELIGQ